MLFTIVLPTYNVEPYIDRCIRSIISQSFTDFEVVFIDDCGSDKSIDIVERYKEADNRIKIIRNKKNMGTYHARRIGVNNSKGKYILFLDPDDELRKDLLKKLSISLGVRGVDLVFYDVDFSPKEKFYTTSQSLLPFKNKPRVLESVFRNRGRKAVFHMPGGKLFKRSLLVEVYSKLNVKKDYRYVYSEDQLLYYAYLLRNPSYAVLNYKGYIYHKNHSSITHKVNTVFEDYIIDQKKFTINKLNNLYLQYDLSKKEKLYLYNYLTKTSESLISLMQRYEISSKRYLFHVWNAFKKYPNIKNFMRIVLYIISIKKIKL